MELYRFGPWGFGLSVQGQGPVLGYYRVTGSPNPMNLDLHADLDFLGSPREQGLL